MTGFEGGPAAGAHLMLRRTPYFLRVVILNGRVDALDQLSDTPAEGEQIHAYYMNHNLGSCHVLMRGERGGRNRGGFFQCAQYAYVEEQPTDAEMRDTTAWRSWCLSHQPKHIKFADVESSVGGLR